MSSTIDSSSGTATSQDPVGRAQRAMEALMQEAPAEPAQAEPESAQAEGAAPEPAKSWKDTLIPEDDEEIGGFFKGKPVKQLAESYRHLEAELQKRGREAMQREAELAALKAVKDVLIAPQVQRAPQDPWQAQGVNPETDIWDKPKEVLAAQGRMQEQRMLEVAQQTREQILAELRREQEQKEIIKALEDVRSELGISENAFGTLAPKLFWEVTNNGQSPTDRKAYKEKAVQLIQEFTPSAPVPAVAPKAPPVAANPPGSKKPGAAPEVAPNGAPTLKREQREIIEHMGRLAASVTRGNFDMDRYLATAAERLNGGKR